EERRQFLRHRRRHQHDRVPLLPQDRACRGLRKASGDLHRPKLIVRTSVISHARDHSGKIRLGSGSGSISAHARLPHVPITTSKMTKILAATNLLRAINAAEERFIALWAVDCLFDEARVIEKLSIELGRYDASVSSGYGSWTMN